MISQAICNPQEERRMEVLKKLVGGNMALYILCAYHNIQFKPELACGNWEAYLGRVDIKIPFRDGVTDPNKAMEQGVADMDRWLRVWGQGNEKRPYTPADYRRMDEIYEKMTERRRATGGFDGQQEDVFRFCARTAHQRDLLMAKGGKDDIDSAKKLDKMIQDNLAAENLRKKDEPTQQQVRIDGVVERLNKAGLSVGMSYDDVMGAFASWMMKKGRYGCTMDAAEKAILAIVNCTRGNSDLPPISELPEDERLGEYQHEFDATAQRREEGAYAYLGLSAFRPSKRKKEPDAESGGENKENGEG